MRGEGLLKFMNLLRRECDGEVIKMQGGKEKK
jgi:hypothetical protein